MKKRLLALFVLTIFNGSLHAQTSVYHPFPQSGISWREDMDGVGFSCCCTSGSWQSYCLTEDNYELFLDGDTTIGSHVYSKIYRLGYFAEYLLSMYPFTCESGCTNYDPQFYGNIYVGGLRQDIPGRKVYFHPAESGAQDTLLYDFNLSVGDYLSQTYNNETMTNMVSSIDSVLIGTEYHTRYWLDYEQQHEYIAIIEGIGSTYGLLFALRPPFEFTNQLVCVKINSNPVYPDTETICSLNEIGEVEQIFSFSVSPNPVETSALLQVSPEFANVELVIYNESGQEVKRKKLLNTSVKIDRSEFDSGVYFFKGVNQSGQVAIGKFMIH